jgi:hypothetical protein
MLEKELKPTIHSKHNEIIVSGVVLHHDNAWPHTEAGTYETTQKLKSEVFPHPAISPELAPLDYQIFRPHKDALCGHQFANNEEVKNVVHR